MLNNALWLVRVVCCLRGKGAINMISSSKIWSIYLYFNPLGALKPCWFPLPTLQIRLWIYKPYYTTYMKKYPVLCVWARSLNQKYCRVFIHFAFIVWTRFNERVANMARSHARNVAESFKFLEVDILKTCRPTFEWTVCWMSWQFKNATWLE